MQVLAELPEQQRQALAFAFERRDDVQRPFGFAGKPRLRELSDVETRDVGDGGENVAARDLARRAG